MKGNISEIFKSIQGEGLYQGDEQVFIRFFGCNLQCSFCDTKLRNYSQKSVLEVLQEVRSHSGCDCVSVTGGEPLLQIDFLTELAKELKNDGKAIHLETNGVLYKDLSKVVNFIDTVAMDFKLSSSTGMRDFWREHREFLKISQEKEVFVKAVIGKDTLIEDVRIALAIIKEVDRDLFFVLQPENPFEELMEKKLNYFEKTCKQAGINVKIMPQLHKMIGVK